MTEAPATPLPPSSRWTLGSARTLIWCRFDAASVLGALLTIAVAWGIAFTHMVLTFLPALTYGGDNSSFWPVLVAYGLWRLLFFFGAAFVLLATSVPVVSESTLPRVLARAAISGFVGTVGLIGYGTVTVASGVQAGYPGAEMAEIWLQPLADGFGFTALLLVGATVGWLVARRRARKTSAPPDGNQ